VGVITRKVTVDGERNKMKSSTYHTCRSWKTHWCHSMCIKKRTV